ncbi:MAG TPA: ABC transporter substrate-binding protein [Xanthobacteraceae bacterium]|jgi:putative ABC transport system substrate-binding protein
MKLLGAGAAWPLVARAQQLTFPTIGLLNPTSLDVFADELRAFHNALREAGYVDGDNLAILYRWAENRLERLPALAAELVQRNVAVIATTGGPAAAKAAKAATTSIPIVFIVNEDPVRLGLVESLARPGGNLTGVNFFTGEVAAKRLELLHELVPAAARVAVLIDPTNETGTETTLRHIEAAARAMALELHLLNASTSGEIDAAFAIISRERLDALFVSPSPFFSSRRVQLTHLASRHAVPAAYALRSYAEAGGLMSYGTSLGDAYRQVAVYVGRILKGANPSDLPVVQSSKFDLVINGQIARMLGLAVPATLLAIADEIIE